MKPTLLLGAPGTGKTYQLVEKIRELKPERFALVSFTRRAANEAKQRLRAYYNDSDLRYVRTLHSLCFELLGLRTNQVMGWEHLKAFGEQYGYEFTFRSRSQEDGTYYGMTDDDQEYREMMIQVAKTGEFYSDEFSSNMKKNYNNFKGKQKLYDYHDMICYGITAKVPRLDLICVDEIQDLTPIQLDFIKHLTSQSEEVIYAGDGNQMIFEWAGVERERFLALENECTVMELKQNYRLPNDIYWKAFELFGKYGRRTFNINHIRWVSYLPDFNPNETYLILARNNYILRNLIIQDEDYQLPNWSWLQLDPKPINVWLSTIHGAKGAEADNVILHTDVSPATYEQIDSDSEKRVWYVGITRARKRLYIMEPQTDCFYDLT